MEEYMDGDNFRIVFDQVPHIQNQSSLQTEAERAEIDEIDELRRLALEIGEPEPTSYTST
jgi:hypothetical protein